MIIPISVRRQRAVGRRAPFGRFGEASVPQPNPLYAVLQCAAKFVSVCFNFQSAGYRNPSAEAILPVYQTDFMDSRHFLIYLLTCFLFSFFTNF